MGRVDAFSRGFVAICDSPALAGEGWGGGIAAFHNLIFEWRELPPPVSHLRCDTASPASGRGEVSSRICRRFNQRRSCYRNIAFRAEALAHLAAVSPPR